MGNANKAVPVMSIAEKKESLERIRSPVVDLAHPADPSRQASRTRPGQGP
jgi:hypothetical protein